MTENKVVGRSEAIGLSVVWGAIIISVFCVCGFAWGKLGIETLIGILLVFCALGFMIWLTSERLEESV